MKIVSFYCDVDDSKFYTTCANALISRCKDMGLDYCIEEVSYGDDWISNVRAKPLFLKNMLDRFDCDILWVDADCDITGDIKNILISGEWGVCMRGNSTPHDYVHNIRNNEHNKRFVDTWISTILTQNKGSHSAFVSLYDTLNIFQIPNNLFELGLSEVKSKGNYFNE